MPASFATISRMTFERPASGLRPPCSRSLELLAERRRGHRRGQLGANNRPAAAFLFGQRDPTMPKQSLQRSGEKLAESAEEIKLSTYGVEDSAERTTQLAADRTVFAAERTYAAWVRTGLLAMASGIGAKALLSGSKSRSPKTLSPHGYATYSTPNSRCDDASRSE